MKIGFLFSNNNITRIMQDADLFEKFKVLICPMAICTVEKWGEEETLKAIEKKEKEQEKEFNLIAFFSKEEIHFIDPEVRVVSTGVNWMLIEEYIPLVQSKL